MTLPKINPTTTTSWKLLENCSKEEDIKALFESNLKRAQDFSISFDLVISIASPVTPIISPSLLPITGGVPSSSIKDLLFLIIRKERWKLFKI